MLSVDSSGCFRQLFLPALMPIVRRVLGFHTNATSRFEIRLLLGMELQGHASGRSDAFNIVSEWLAYSASSRWAITDCVGLRGANLPGKLSLRGGLTCPLHRERTQNKVAGPSRTQRR